MSPLCSLFHLAEAAVSQVLLPECLQLIFRYEEVGGWLGGGWEEGMDKNDE